MIIVNIFIPYHYNWNIVTQSYLVLKSYMKHHEMINLDN